MLTELVIVVSLLFFSCLCVEESVNKEISKRNDVDVQTCIENFDIHKDKIIRTQDSQAMGAKYLNEIDLDSREECLRLCCESDDCDVFVYEEKNSGSCYLFRCGPPEDFKCKFTHHVNYTSAVLAVNRHLPDLESQIKLTKHEQDLSKLRKPDAIPTGNLQMSPSTYTTVAPKTTTTAKIKNSETNTKTSIDSRKCSIYQFECRSTGECIAIYNACDGIPQCADGSDEAPELHCPDSTTINPSLQKNQEVLNPELYKSTGQVRVPLVQSPPQPQDIYHSSNINPKPPATHQEPDFIRPISSDQIGMRIPYDGPPVSPYQYLPQSPNTWAHHQPINQLQPQIPQFPDKNSHIFNHKENGLQVPDVGEPRYNKYKGAMQTLHRALGYASAAGQVQYGDPRDYQKLSNYEIYGQPLPAPVPENWPNHQDYRNNYNNPYGQEVNPGGRETWSQNIPVVNNNPPENTVYKTIPANKELPNNWKVEKETPKHEQEQMAHELKHSKEHFNTSSNIKKESIVVHTADDGHDHGKYSVVAEYKIAETIEDIEDGVAETPGSAVLSLTLGLILTCMMGILIGCRLRVVRRRLRRGGKSYAHDADYLVNGMYL